MESKPTRSYKPIAPNQKCSCGGRLFLRKTLQVEGGKIFGCPTCGDRYFSATGGDIERRNRQWVEGVQRERYLQTQLVIALKEELRQQQELFLTNPTDAQENKIGQAEQKYRKMHLQVHRPILAHFRRHVERGPGRPRGSKKKRDSMLSVLIAISIKSGMLTPSQVLDALQMKKSSNNYNRFIPNHVEQGAHLVESLDLFPRGKAKESNPRNPKIMLNRLSKFRQA